MNRTIKYLISEEEKNMRISRYLRKRGFSRQSLIELKKRENSVLVNDAFRRFNEFLKAGDVVTVHICEEEWSDIEPVLLPLCILHEDEDLMVVSKSAGMPTHPSYHNRGNSLANACMYYFRQQNKPFVFRCCNRLDRDTSGITIISKHLVSAGILSEMGTARKLHRQYLGIVRGQVFPPEGSISFPLGRKPGSIIERIPDPEGEEAFTRYRVVYEGKTHSLLMLSPETGRTHQLRVHLKYAGFPLIGDYLYNPDMEHISRQALHAFRMTFHHPITGEELSFTAPLPDDMRAVFAGETDFPDIADIPGRSDS